MKLLLKTFLLLLSLAAFQFSSGQNILINENGGTPDASAALEVRATDKGMLVPRMVETNRLAISSPAQGLLVFQTNGLVGFYYHNGTGWDTLIGSTIINVSNVTNENNANIAIVRDVKASGVDGGTFNNNAWRTRDLNDLRGDSSFITINGTNSFTLDSGIYEVQANAPSLGVNENQMRLYNSTTAKVEAVGNAVKSVAATSLSFLSTVIYVTSGTNTFIIQHQSENSNSGNGFGDSVNWGENVYTQVRIQKL